MRPFDFNRFPQKVLVDMDGILADLLTDWLRIYNNEYNDNLRIDNINEWDLGSYVKPECGWDGMDRILRKKGTFFNLKPLAGAIDAMRVLDSVKDWEGNKAFELFIVTSATAGPLTMMEKARWVEKYLPFIDLKHFMPAYYKYMVEGDVLIDDAVKNIVPYRERWPDSILCTIQYPRNATKEMLDAVDIVGLDWKDTRAAWSHIVLYLLGELPGGVYQPKDEEACQNLGIQDHTYVVGYTGDN